MSMFEAPTTDEQLVFDLVADIFIRTTVNGRRGVWLEEERQCGTSPVQPCSLVRRRIRKSATARCGHEGAITGSTGSDRILTIAGLAHASMARPPSHPRLNLISAVGTSRKNVRLIRSLPERPKVPALALSWREGIDASLYGGMVIQLLQKEPATWHCPFNPPTAEWHEVELSPEIRRFAGVQSVDD